MSSEKLNLGILIFEITDACNQNCRFCYNYWKGLKETVTPPAPIYKNAAKVLRCIYKQATVTSLSLSGGEPMLLPRIHDLVLTARLHNTQVNILTNGTLLTQQDVSLFQTLDVGRIQIPLLSADPQVHDALTQQQGSWEKAVAAWKMVSQQKESKASAVLILTGENVEQLPQTLMWYASLGVKSVLLNRFNLGGNGRLFRESLSLSHSRLREAFSRVNTFAARTGIRFSSGVCTPVCVLNPLDYPHIAFSFCHMDVKSRPLTVNYQGQVRFCNHSPRILGNLFERPLRDILSDPTHTAYYSRLPESCRNCIHASRCQGGCRAASEQVYNDFLHVDPIMEITE